MHCWKVYEFIITSTDYTLAGHINVHPDDTEAEVTHAVMLIYAKEAHKQHIHIDPFNAQIIIKRI